MESMNKRHKVIIIIMWAAILLPASIVMNSCGGPGEHLQSRNELLTYRNATASKVLSADGELIGKFYLENRTNVSYRQLPPYLIKALVATEDARFFEHKGVDSRSLARVLFKTVLLNKKPFLVAGVMPEVFTGFERGVAVSNCDQACEQYGTDAQFAPEYK